MRRFSDLVSVARVDAAVDRFLAFFRKPKKKKKSRFEKPRSRWRESNLIQSAIRRVKF